MDVNYSTTTQRRIMMKMMFLVMCIALGVSTSFANEGIEADDPVGSVAAPVSLRGIWVNPTDDTMENGLSVLAHPWPDYQGSMITYINLHDPAHGLDPSKDYQITNIQFCIKHKDDNYYNVDESRIIIQEWGGDAPTETNLYEQLFDTDGWGYPEDYTWTDPVPITEPYPVLPSEFAIGWHIYWPVGGAFANWWLGLDEDAPIGNWYYYQGEWRHMTPYDGAFGVRFEVEEVNTANVDGDISSVLHAAAYPNPFNPRTTVSFGLSMSQHVTLEVLDVGGRTVKTLCDRPLMAGTHNVPWNGRDNDGREVFPGTYFAVLRSREGRSVQKLTLLR
jgi:hypothetical protein